MIDEARGGFRAAGTSAGREAPPSYPPAIPLRIPSGSLDEAGGRGSRSRRLRFEPGISAMGRFVHEGREEVLVVSGDLAAGDDETGRGGGAFSPVARACRPPGPVHAALKCEGGCALLERQDLDPA